MLRHECIDTITMPVATSGTLKSWKSWISEGVSLLVSDMARIVKILAQWQDRETMRARLAEFDDHLLSDLGITRAQATMETGKPFWQD
ncbi:MAG: DUF1127 domain-containing protein [Rhodospirillaceae bacterium]|jgi:uncharacterized protein YjiS (DUF1127 family)|nr:DUF1127 domain-containing protein [Rhodospirillaceae bacterium]MBT5245645.1 DUF1127 domain-containing protein [Rhodospirillaceae bacterium]MBT5562355.1 DUF1127 domain-containing protein [Rhodospirillaceae bacterium]MBT6241583.1 DUF1127 domain-containing protein [Rhodospirillaceae bacterium]MBT7138804.1 DUF1127 domain-containing protein [Rhodospirillaceae bacterium]